MATDFWTCNSCGAQNSVLDGECQFCECGGAECGRDNCDDPRHFCNCHELLTARECPNRAA